MHNYYSILDMVGNAHKTTPSLNAEMSTPRHLEALSKVTLHSRASEYTWMATSIAHALQQVV